MYTGNFLVLNFKEFVFSHQGKNVSERIQSMNEIYSAIYVVYRIQMVRQKGSLTKRMDLE
jgi:hypothetical protein